MNLIKKRLAQKNGMEALRLLEKTRVSLKDMLSCFGEKIIAHSFSNRCDLPCEWEDPVDDKILENNKCIAKCYCLMVEHLKKRSLTACNDQEWLTVKSKWNCLKKEMPFEFLAQITARGYSGLGLLDESDRIRLLKDIEAIKPLSLINAAPHYVTRLDRGGQKGMVMDVAWCNANGNRELGLYIGTIVSKEISPKDTLNEMNCLLSKGMNSQALGFMDGLGAMTRNWQDLKEYIALKKGWEDLHITRRKSLKLNGESVEEQIDAWIKIGQTLDDHRLFNQNDLDGSEWINAFKNVLNMRDVLSLETKTSTGMKIARIMGKKGTAFRSETEWDSQTQTIFNSSANFFKISKADYYAMFTSAHESGALERQTQKNAKKIAQRL